MPGKVSAIWDCDYEDMTRALDECVRESLEKVDRVKVFFRADDVAAPSRNFTRLVELFHEKRAPLSLAVVPSWVSKVRWEALLEAANGRSSQWCWHQHGWRHANHEPEGKKQEFGPSRSKEELGKDINAGRQRLESIMEDDFYPAFTPPWNRCGLDALESLQEFGYKAISRSKGAKPASENLPDYYVNVDLHTRRESDAAKDCQSFFAELSQALTSGYCGVMIHHQLMNPASFDFLEVLIQAFLIEKKLDLVGFNAFD